MRVRKAAKDRKAEAVTAALDLAFERGPEGVTTGLIADRMGLTQPAIYKHFPLKEDIWRAVTETLCLGIAENVARAEQNAGTPRDRLRELVMGHLSLIERHPALPEIMVMREPGEMQGELREKVWASMSTVRSALVNAIREAQTCGQIRTDIDAGETAALIIGIIQSLVLRLLLSRDTGILLREGQGLLDLQLALLAGQGAID